MFRLLAPALALLLSLSAYTVFAQDVITDAVPIQIDGITRTLTVTFAPTGVLSVDVAPISDTFKVTATQWLSDLYALVGDIEPSIVISADQRIADMRLLFDATGTTSYPGYYSPFVRQYRFAIHSCRYWTWFHGYLLSVPDGFDAFSIGIFYTLRNGCVEQYQDAYVEMERIAHPLP